MYVFEKMRKFYSTDNIFIIFLNTARGHIKKREKLSLRSIFFRKPRKQNALAIERESHKAAPRFQFCSDTDKLFFLSLFLLCITYSLTFFVSIFSSDICFFCSVFDIGQNNRTKYKCYIHESREKKSTSTEPHLNDYRKTLYKRLQQQ